MAIRITLSAHSITETKQSKMIIVGRIFYKSPRLRPFVFKLCSTALLYALLSMCFRFYIHFSIWFFLTEFERALLFPGYGLSITRLNYFNDKYNIAREILLEKPSGKSWIKIEYVFEMASKGLRKSALAVLFYQNVFVTESKSFFWTLKSSALRSSARTQHKILKAVDLSCRNKVRKWKGFYDVLEQEFDFVILRNLRAGATFLQSFASYNWP